MANILTPAEGATILRTDIDEANLLDLLPQVDVYIKNATGHDWAADTVINPAAKRAARMALVQWHEDPGGMASGSSLSLGLMSALVQLEALALRYKQYQGRNGAGPCDLTGACIGDTVATLVGLIGATGDQSAAFEGVITVDGYIQQVSTGDLSGNWYRVCLVPVEGL